MATEMSPRSGSGDWGTEDWRDRQGVRANHDQDHDWLAQEEELEKWLGRFLAALALLGVWKLLDLCTGSLGGFAGLLGWILTRLA